MKEVTITYQMFRSGASEKTCITLPMEDRAANELLQQQASHWLVAEGGALDRLLDNLAFLQGYQASGFIRAEELPAAKFYFTYASEGQAYSGGWTEVNAPDQSTATRAFQIFHANKSEYLISCAGIYDETSFQQTPMAIHGNFGKRCVESIELNRTELTV